MINSTSTTLDVYDCPASEQAPPITTGEGELVPEVTIIANPVGKKTLWNIGVTYAHRPTCGRFDGQHAYAPNVD
jgi:hypothetical protein